MLPRPLDRLLRVGRGLADRLPTSCSGLMLVWLATRVVTAVLVIGAPGIRSLGAWHDDIELYLVWAQDIAAGAYPHDDPMWQYPPLAGAVFVLAWLLTPRSLTGFVLLALAADGLILRLLVHDVRRRGGDIAGLRLWAVLPLLTGPLLLGRFDVFPAAAAAAAVLLLWRGGSGATAGVAVGIGTLLKAWPVALLLVPPRALLLRMAVAAAATTAGVLAITLPRTGGALSFLGFQGDRGLQIESAWALPYLVARSLGAPVATPYRFGAREVEAVGTDLLPLAASALTLLFLAALALLRWTGRLDHLPIADTALLAVLGMVTLSRVISPQFAVWLLALAAVCLLDVRTTMRRVIALIACWSALGVLLYPFLYDGLRDAHGWSVTLQAARIALLVVALVEGLAIALRRPSVLGYASGSIPRIIDLRRPAGVSHVHD